MERVVERVPADRALGFELLDLWFTHPLITYREPEPHGDALEGEKDKIHPWGTVPELGLQLTALRGQKLSTHISQVEECMSESILSKSTQSWGHRLKSDATQLPIAQGEGLSNPMGHTSRGTRMNWLWRWLKV